jgi:transcriptional regulator with XRE-family HTH domain|tara:strand:+ start:1436 stop:1972 length:537 start_codon:yes stop_codon:yes gene_type:complete
MSLTKPTFDFSPLRGLRKREGMTIEQVSDRSGVSVAVISKIERNKNSAELDTLYRIGRVFGMNAADMISLAESPFAHRATESDHTNGGFSFRHVNYSNVRAIHATASAGAAISSPEIHRDDHELCWVLTGRLCITLPHEEVNLNAGESLQFDAVFEHTYKAITDCELILMHVRKENRY